MRREHAEITWLLRLPDWLCLLLLVRRWPEPFIEETDFGLQREGPVDLWLCV